MRVVARQLRAGKRVERDGNAFAAPGDLTANRLRAVVVADRLPSVEEVELRGPMRVERIRHLHTGLIVRRELAHPAARVRPVVLREEALEPDMGRVDAGFDEKPRADRDRRADAGLVHEAPDVSARCSAGGFGRMNHCQMQG